MRVDDVLIFSPPNLLGFMDVYPYSSLQNRGISYRYFMVFSHVLTHVEITQACMHGRGFTAPHRQVATPQQSSVFSSHLKHLKLSTTWLSGKVAENQGWRTSGRCCTWNSHELTGLVQILWDNAGKLVVNLDSSTSVCWFLWRILEV